MSKRWLMIADAHLTCREPEDEFFRMLDGVSRLPADIGIIFLGDIFDLWIALRGYENDDHRRFLEWCRREKERRQIVFLLGGAEQNGHDFGWFFGRAAVDGAPGIRDSLSADEEP
ncbi:MAG: hypothetical protein J6W70_05105, partial [Lentisphaeria bacterium]|nr:hypothetical protein [Lentisphaeria bacterium]